MRAELVHPSKSPVEGAALGYRAGKPRLLISGFFAELRRRKVYRVAAAYVVVGGFIIQIASIVFPTWELPVWSLRLLIVFVLAGFPIALIFAWVFDITPAGIERTSKVEPTGAFLPRVVAAT